MATKEIEEEKKKLTKRISEEKQKEKKQNLEKAAQLLATRQKIERDYDEDKIKVTFYTSPETQRTVLARKPNNKEMMTVMILSARATKFEGSADPDSLLEMVEIYEKLASMAAELSIDPELDEEFWGEHVSFSTLQSFVTELVTESQSGHSVSSEEMKNFR